MHFNSACARVALFIVALLATPISSHAGSQQVSGLLGSAATSQIFDELSTTLSSKIAEAKDAGKEVELEFYKTLTQSLERLREILKSSAGDLDRTAELSLRKATSEMNGLLHGVDSASRSRVFDLMVIANTLNQAVADVPLVKDRRTVTTVWPTVIRQRAAGEVAITVLGVGLVDCRRVVLEIAGKRFEPTTNLGNKLEFTLPHSVFAHDMPGEKTVSGALILDPGLLKRNVRVPVGFRVFPDLIASFTLDPQVDVTTLRYSDEIIVPFAKLDGKDGRRSVTVKPTKAGWHIDPNSVSVSKIGGEKSSPMRFDGAITELGFVIYSDMGSIKRALRSSRPGWATFSYRWREFTEEQSVMSANKIQGQLRLRTGAVSYTLAPNTSAITGTLKDFTGRTFVITPGRTTYGWIRVDHLKSGKLLVIDSDL